MRSGLTNDEKKRIIQYVRMLLDAPDVHVEMTQNVCEAPSTAADVHVVFQFSDVRYLLIKAREHTPPGGKQTCRHQKPTRTSQRSTRSSSL